MQVVAATFVHALQGKSFQVTGARLSGGMIDVEEVDAELPTSKDASVPNTGCWAKFSRDGDKGWVHLKDLLPVAHPQMPWLQVAHGEIGTGEEADAQFKYINEIASAAKKSISKKRALDWCACFMYWCVRKAGYDDAPNSAMAQAWAKWGETRIGDGTLEGARLGDIAVGQRGDKSSPSGHVAIYITDIGGEWILLLGGNQDESPTQPGGAKSVRYAWYPRKWKVTGVDPQVGEGRLLTVRCSTHP